MPKYRVPLTGHADVTVTVETDSTDPEEILEEAQQQGVSALCAQYSGWGQDWSLELGEEWEPVTFRNNKQPIIYNEDATELKYNA